MFMLKTFILILSEKNSLYRNIQRKKLLNFNNKNFIFYYFIGDPDMPKDYKVDNEKNIIYLNVQDSNLPLKFYKALRFINENYYFKINNIFKISDTVNLDLNLLEKTQKFNKNSKCLKLEDGIFLNKKIIKYLLINKESFKEDGDINEVIGETLSKKDINIDILDTTDIISDLEVDLKLPELKKIEIKKNVKVEPPKETVPVVNFNPRTRQPKYCRYCKGLIQEIVKNYDPRSGIPNRIYKICTRCQRLMD